MASIQWRVITSKCESKWTFSLLYCFGHVFSLSGKQNDIVSSMAAWQTEENHLMGYEL